MSLNALISPDYRALNAELHASSPEYGASLFEWPVRASRAAASRYDCRTVLDYGCGKGKLRHTFPALQEYDPAIPGKDSEPRPADLVVCADVLEHVEPDKIDAVLDHLRRLSQKVCLLSICLVPAQKTLADGRNAHLLVKPADWWAERLERYFDLQAFDATPTHVRALGKPKLYEPNITTFQALTGEQRLAHAVENIKRVKGRLKEDAAHERKAVLVCYGPSLKWTYRQAASDGNADIFSVSGSHKFLIDCGIIPDVHIDCDPREHKARQFGKPRSDVDYWIASCIHPAYLDRLRGFHVWLWHLWSGDETLPLMDHLEPGEWCVQGGGSVGLRALMLLYCMGYRDFEIHGMDCSFADGEPYAGEHFGKPHRFMRVKCGERWFDTGASLVAYAQQFFLTRQVMQGATIRLHGDGLLQHMVRIQQEAS